MAKITQTAGRNALSEFAPEFAHFNDDVLFGENWNNQDIDVKMRSIQCARTQKRWYSQSVRQTTDSHSIFPAEVSLHRFRPVRLAFSM